MLNLLGLARGICIICEDMLGFIIFIVAMLAGSFELRFCCSCMPAMFMFDMSSVISSSPVGTAPGRMFDPQFSPWPPNNC